LKDCKNAENRYKLALLCMKLNKYEEAEKALLNSKNVSMRTQSKENKDRQIPKGASGHYLLGLIHQKKEKESDA
jgi:hypothetical protein